MRAVTRMDSLSFARSRGGAEKPRRSSLRASAAPRERFFWVPSFAVALIGLAVAGPAAAQDVVHGQVQAFLNVLQGGGDFANSEFKDAVKPGDAARLRGLVECDLNSVKRSDSGTSAIVLFDCAGASGKSTTAVMILFSGGKAVSIAPVSYVQVPERG